MTFCSCSQFSNSFKGCCNSSARFWILNSWGLHPPRRNILTADVLLQIQLWKDFCFQQKRNPNSSKIHARVSAVVMVPSCHKSGTKRKSLGLVDSMLPKISSEKFKTQRKFKYIESKFVSIAFLLVKLVLFSSSKVASW